MTLDKTDFQTCSNSGTGSHDKTGMGGGGFPSGDRAADRGVGR